MVLAYRFIDHSCRCASSTVGDRKKHLAAEGKEKQLMVYESCNIEAQFPPIPGLFYLQRLDLRKMVLFKSLRCKAPTIWRDDRGRCASCLVFQSN